MEENAKKIVVLGVTGAGKSTLINLIVHNNVFPVNDERWRWSIARWWNPILPDKNVCKTSNSMERITKQCQIVNTKKYSVRFYQVIDTPGITDTNGISEESKRNIQKNVINKTFDCICVVIDNRYNTARILSTVYTVVHDVFTATQLKKMCLIITHVEDIGGNPRDLTTTEKESYTNKFKNLLTKAVLDFRQNNNHVIVPIIGFNYDSTTDSGSTKADEIKTFLAHMDACIGE